MATLAGHLSPVDRLRLVEQIVHDLTASTNPEPMKRRTWSEIRGIVAHPLCGEDAQAWVSRTRREGDEEREKQWRSIL